MYGMKSSIWQRDKRVARHIVAEKENAERLLA
jgi:hypothetical protein